MSQIILLALLLVLSIGISGYYGIDFTMKVAPILTVLVIIVFLIMMLWKLLKGTIRLLVQYGWIFGASVPNRLVGLALASYFNPKPVFLLLQAPFKLVLSLYRYAIGTLMQLQSIYFSSETVGDYKRFLESQGLSAHQILEEFVSSIWWVDIIWILAVWIVFGQMLDIVIGPHDEDALARGGIGRLGNYIRSLNTKAQKKAALVTIFLLGAYLSIASIAAVPWLQEYTVQEEFNANQLRKSMQDSGFKKDEFDQQYPDNYVDVSNPFVELENAIKRYSENAQDPVREAFAEVKKELSSLTDQRQRISNSWKELRIRIWNSDKRTQDLAFKRYNRLSLESRGTREKIKYFGDIDQWYRDAVILLKDKLDTAKVFIDSMNIVWKQRADRILDRLSAASQEKTESLIAELGSLNSFDYGTENLMLFNSMHEIFNPPLHYQLPEPPEPGLGWGPFGLLASWLLKTQSLPLASITGMIGVGLLGAALRSFWRQERGGGGASEVQDTIAGVTIRGFSAALVVFLGVKGGLAIFGSETGDANPYSLLLTCFAGAVFSEDVWMIMRDRLGLGGTAGSTSNTSSSKQEEEDTGNTSPAGTAPKI
ncbi:MAG: hypothetical protein KC587_05960 [Nitrospira sp.]|nr:hypothetical protein [Nitrospira sp.]MCW5783533.1 hypothetical protein [Nitrospirales bacterium]